ncbi:hypothetical protein AB4Y32_09850 [Paraburkholderia phymatum]|uniref:Uncharacterized protein n=1 Tax=Paraburkholderia phymatum TaxID=148447 RepID=A0ACC6TXU7_9BURK
MRLIISAYLRTLRERDEFDCLLPDLAIAMGYTPLVRPQTGVRQLGVDLPVAGKNPDDDVEELVLFVIKQGDIGRQEWSSTVQSVRQSLEETLDVYLTKYVEPAHQSIRKKIVVATTGDLKQDTQPNWNGFIEKYKETAVFEFWSGDKVADLIERFMLDEHVFQEEDRVGLRKALAFAGERDYSMLDVDRLLTRQLGLDSQGELPATAKGGKTLAKAIIRLNLALRMFTKAAQDAGDTRQALWAAEHFLLKTWHRVQLSDDDLKDKEVMKAFELLHHSYFEAGVAYLTKLAPHLQTRDGMSGYTGESAEYAIVLLEHVGLIASFGIALYGADKSAEGQEKAGRVAELLCAMLANMPATASPRLDQNAIDVSLALLFLSLVEKFEEIRDWVYELQGRLVFSLVQGWGFPISSDSFDDLVDVAVFHDEDLMKDCVGSSWLAATLATWCVVCDMKEEYKHLVRSLKRKVPQLRPQFWHPDAESTKRWYFEDVHFDTGATEVLDLPEDMEDARGRMIQFLREKEWNVQTSTSAVKAGFLWLDLLNCRHYRFPVSARTWYALAVRPDDASVQQDVGE